MSTSPSRIGSFLELAALPATFSTEADFRGDRFAAHTRDLKGTNDLLVLTGPAFVVSRQDTRGNLWQLRNLVGGGG